MDFATMKMKVDKHVYKSFDEFENDFWLIVNNCKAYNEDGSLYYNLAVKLGTQVIYSASFEQ
jgi:Bromodomain